MKMLYLKERRKKSVRRIILFFFVGFLILPNIVTPTRADYVVIDWGDVVKLKVQITYRRPGEGPRFFSDGFLELYLGETVPLQINETFDRLKTMSEVFRERVIGMRVGETRDFEVNYKELQIKLRDKIYKINETNNQLHFQYNEIGNVSEKFKNQKPFTINNKFGFK